MRIKAKQMWQFLGWGIFLFIATLSTLFGQRIPAAVSYVLPLFSLAFLALSNKLMIKKYLPHYYLPWFLFIVFMLAGSALLRFDNLASSLNRIVGVLVGVVLMGDIRWFRLVRKMLLVFTGLYVAFTWFFFVFRPAYSVMISLYGELPAGVSSWRNGYLAGLANHYSSNGIYISVCLIVLVAYYLTCRGGNGKKNRLRRGILLCALILSFGALLLTGKRGVLLWSIGAILLTNLVISKRKVGEIIRLAAVGGCFLMAVFIVVPMIPELGVVFDRLTTMGEDNSSLERIYMWRLALSMFFQHPILGSGFWSFRNQYERSLFGIINHNSRYIRLDAHNVYFQVLGETGIIGFVIYILAIGLLLFDTMKLARSLRQHPDMEIRFGVRFSLCIQFFYLLYSLSGNCLYDIVFYFYAVAMAITTALKYHVRQNHVKA